ncbi:MAG: FAD-binding oxidoreductase [Colwellia sp.]|nr:FAD-binding oxidoreductase [Colwellia sp.]
MSFLLLLSFLIIYIFVDFDNTNPPKQTKPTIVNDITQLNPIEVTRVVQPSTIEDIVEAIKSSSGPISIGGGRFSQGGQTAYPDSIHLDMRSFNKVLNLDVSKRQVTVQSGITWRDLQEVIDAENLSVKIMQTYANFTVGGSLSVNVHGRYLGEGPIIRSVESIKLIKANGDVVNASPSDNSELFYGTIGGYGGIAVIAEVTLNLVGNVKVKRYTKNMVLHDYQEYFAENIRNDKSVVFHNADIYPPDFTNVRSVSWLKTNEALTVEQRLIPKNKEYTWQPKVTEFVADSNFGKWMRQYIMEPLLYSFDAVQWRNYEASYDVNELEPSNRTTQTYALREYFVPVESFDSFAIKMAAIFKKYQTNIINVSIRHSLPDSGSLLAWARTEVFAFVVYYRQGTSEAAQQEVKLWSQEVIDAVIEEHGAYYLPYQLHASTPQFMKAYPRATEFFVLKEKEDPKNRFINQLWSQHYLKQQVE